MKASIYTRTMLIAGFVGSAAFASAQVEAVQTVQKQNFWMTLPDYFDNPWIIFGGMIFFVLAFAFYALAKSVMVLSRKISGEMPVAQEALAAHVKKPGIWDWLMNALTRSVPVAKEADVMLNHNYDGIRELDNQLPPWWKWGFVFTIIFAFVYMISYHVTGTGKLSYQEYAEELNLAALQKEERIRIAGNEVTEENVIAMAGESDLEEGKNIFIKNCMACHGDKGQGMVGPNLTDEFWIHGGGIKNVFRTITEGVPNKGMISWKAQLAPKQIQEVASFILTLKGTNPPGAKEPQGDPWMEESKTDSAATVMRDTVPFVAAKNL